MSLNVLIYIIIYVTIILAPSILATIPLMRVVIREGKKTYKNGSNSLGSKKSQVLRKRLLFTSVVLAAVIALCLLLAFSFVILLIRIVMKVGVKFMVKRLAYGVIVLICVVSVVFALFNSLPVDPARLTLGQRADVESVEAIRAELGLDKPKLQQYFMYLNDVSPMALHDRTPEAKAKYKYFGLIPFGNTILVVKKPYLRRSYQRKRLVSEILLEALPKTAILAVSAIIIACLIGIILGMLAAVRQHSTFDHAAMSLSVVGISVPSYLSALIFGYLFGILWSDWTGLNSVGDLTVFDDNGKEVIELKNIILPALALGIRPIGIIFQLTRSAMLDVLSQDYIRTARAKGMAFSRVLFKHALRNAMNPVVTTISGWFASLLAGAYFIELIFVINGLGKETVDALLKFDFPVVMGAVLFTATAFVIVNIVVDILYGVLDPRVSIGN